MNDIDLIPRSYRDAVRIRHLVERGALGLIAMLAIGLAAFSITIWQVRVQTAQLVPLRNEANRVAALRQQMEKLAAEKSKIEGSSTALTALRGTGEPYQLAEAIDAALSANVWLSSIRFSREQQALDATQAAAAQSNGGVVITAPNGAPGQDGRPLRLTNTVEIKGTAIDHTALAEFIKALSSQPGLADVRLLNSTITIENSIRTIEFAVAAAVRSSQKEKALP